MKNNSLSDFFSSSAELAAIEHFLHLIAKTNTFDQRLEVLQEQLGQSEQRITKDKQQYQDEIKKLTQKYNKQFDKKNADLETLEIRYRQEIDELKQKLKQQNDKPHIVNPAESQPSKKQSINSAAELEKGVWTDSKTSLMWARISIGQEWESGRCLGRATELNLADAKKSCQLFRLAGYKDWRLPTIEELKTLLDESGKNYQCGRHILFNPAPATSGWYWSSTQIGEKYAYLNFYNFHSGVDVYCNYRHVRPVRNI